jgi:hypothetical protein
MNVWITATVVCLTFGACNATEGALLVRIGGADASTVDGASDSPPTAAVRSGMSLQYQIADTLDTRVDADLFVTDLFDTSKQQVSDLHAAGRVVMAYVSVGSLEPWRDDAGDFARGAVGMPLAAYPNESWLDIRRADVRARMQARLDRAVQKGFDGIFASTLGLYRASSGFDLKVADELDYATFLATSAHARALSIGLSGDFELGQQLAPHYDWVIAMGCIEKNSCSELAPLSAAKLPVFDLETMETDRASTCSQAQSYAISVTFKHRAYDAYRATCP